MILGQSSPRPLTITFPEPVTVTFQVVNSLTNESIHHALIQLYGTDKGLHAGFSGPDGRVRMQVPPGASTINVTKPLFTDPSITPGSGLVLVKLVPKGGIDGQIVGSDGEPAPRVYVELLREVIHMGFKVWASSGGAESDQHGIYHIGDLAAGHYRLKVNLRSVLPDLPREIGPLYAPTYFPNSPTPSTAQIVSLKPGQRERANIKLIESGAYRIAGTITPAVPGASVQMDEAYGPGRTLIPIQNGHFEIPPVSSGLWQLQFSAPNPASMQEALYAETAIEVKNSSVTDLKVPLRPVSFIDVHALGLSPQNPISLFLEANGSGLTRLDIPLPNQATPSWRGVRPGGTYRVIMDLSYDRCIQSLTSGGLDLTRERLVVQPDAQPHPVELQLTDQCGSITGTVDAAAAGTAVLITSGSLAFYPSFISLDANRSFHVPALSAGSYRAYAFARPEAVEYRNPEVMRTFSGQDFTLSGKQTVHVTLKLNAQESN
jgi:hypothetical protein